MTLRIKELLMRLIVLSLLVALTGMVVACGQANEAAESSGGGIQVNGHWTVTVTDPDGTIASVREFDNAFEPYSGGSLLNALLAGDIRVENHQIWIWHPSTAPNAFSCVEDDYGSPSVEKINAVASRDVTTAGTPLMLSAVCTVTGPNPPLTVDPEPFQSGYLWRVQSRFKADSDYAWCTAVPANPTCAVISKFNVMALTSHEENIAVKNNQILAFNIVLSFD
jgi:hypothetical protein